VLRWVIKRGSLYLGRGYSHSSFEKRI